MDLNSEKQRPQKVEVVNNSANPTQTQITNFPLASTGAISVYGAISSVGTLTGMRPTSSNHNVFLDNILLLQGDGTFVPIPLCTILTNVTSSQLNNALASYKSAYATLVSGVTAATLHYSKMAQNGTITSEVYDLKSND